MERDVRPFDLFAEPRLDDDAVEALAIAVREASALAAETLAGVTRRPSTMTIGDLLEPIKDRELPGSGVTIEVSVGGGPCLALVHLTDEHAVALADVFFGGPGGGVDRRPAPIEIKAIVSSLPPVIEPIIAAVTSSGGHAIQLRAGDSATAPASDLVRLSLAFDVDGQGVEAAIFAPDPDRTGATVGPSTDMLDLAAQIPVQFDVDLGAVPMMATEVQELAEGDIVIFDVGIDDEVTLRSGNRDFLRGAVHVDAGRRSLQVTEVLSTH